MRFLIVCGSKMGGTTGLGAMVAESLERKGQEAVVGEATADIDVAVFDTVIVGGALYTMRWHKDARKFVKRNAAVLRALPVYFFSSGPLDDSAFEAGIPPTKQVQKLMAKVGARGHVTFGGRMPADAKGFPASAMARDNPGDWRNPEHVDRWVAQVLEDLTEKAGAR
jgi:menaquinone-dependent protoporphyrinogen oxidase